MKNTIILATLIILFLSISRTFSQNATGLIMPTEAEKEMMSTYRQAYAEDGLMSASIHITSDDVYQFPKYDMRDYKLLPPIQDQKQCQSCWAFSAAVLYESNYAKRNGNLIKVSEQQMVNCMKGAKANHIMNGCTRGGFPQLVFDYLLRHDEKLVKNNDFPYVGQDGDCLPVNAKYELVNYGVIPDLLDVVSNPRTFEAIYTHFFQRVIKSEGKESTTLNSEDSTAINTKVYEQIQSYVYDTLEPVFRKTLKAAILNYGAISCGILVDEDFQNHRKTREVFTGTVYPFTQRKANHAINLVGWDDEKGAWLVRNSWGVDNWGDKGYAWVKYGSNNVGIMGIWAEAKLNPDRLPEKYSINNPTKFGIYSELKPEQEYQEVTLKIDNRVYEWSLTKDTPKILRRVIVENGNHKYQLLVKTVVRTSQGKKIIYGTSSGNLTIEKDKDLNLIWERHIKGNEFKVSFDKYKS